MRDVMLYYCGHGDLLPDREHTYYLVLKGTKPGREVTTGLGIKQFRTMIEAKGVLTSRRCIFILDCCFAGEAAGAWQDAGLNALIEKQIREVLPTRGFAFLTASDKDLRAWGKGGYDGATMFTGALAEVLTAEAASMKRLSLGDLCAAMAVRIRERHDDWKEAVIPQCHAPHQVDGDISRIPMFLAGSSGLARPGMQVSMQPKETPERLGSHGPSFPPHRPQSAPRFPGNSMRQLLSQGLWTSVVTALIYGTIALFLSVYVPDPIARHVLPAFCSPCRLDKSLIISIVLGGASLLLWWRTEAFLKQRNFAAAGILSLFFSFLAANSTLGLFFTIEQDRWGEDTPGFILIGMFIVFIFFSWRRAQAYR